MTDPVAFHDTLVTCRFWSWASGYDSVCKHNTCKRSNPSTEATISEQREMRSVPIPSVIVGLQCGFSSVQEFMWKGCWIPVGKQTHNTTVTQTTSQRLHSSGKVCLRISSSCQVWVWHSLSFTSNSLKVPVPTCTDTNSWAPCTKQT